jgi:pimeloyl-ACP methyl ester carboxylesterase
MPPLIEGSAHAGAQPPLPGAAFVERFVEADGFRIRYREAGQGDVVVSLHGAGGSRLSRAHDLLSQRYRVVAFEVPGFGQSPVNDRSATTEDLGATMLAAVAALGIERCNLMGNSFGGRLALWMAVQRPEALSALALVAPAAIRIGDAPTAASRSVEDMQSLMLAHPERQPPLPAPDPAVAAKQQALLNRLRGPKRDENLERRMRELNIPTLALFGTADRVIPPSVAHLYRQILPNCHLVMVYDAAHAIDADRPEAVAEVIDDFLRHREKFLVRRSSDLIHP